MDAIQTYKELHAPPAASRRAAALQPRPCPGRQSGGRQDDRRTTCRRSGAASGWCWPSPCRWPSRLRSSCSSFPRSTWPRPRSRSTRPNSTTGCRRWCRHDIGRRDPSNHGELCRQPRSQAPEHAARRRGRSAIPASPPRRASTTDPAAELFKTLCRPAGQEDQLVPRLPGGQRPCSHQEAAGAAPAASSRNRPRRENDVKLDDTAELRPEQPRRSQEAVHGRSTRKSNDPQENPHTSGRRPKHPRRTDM